MDAVQTEFADGTHPTLKRGRDEECAFYKGAEIFSAWSYGVIVRVC